MIPVVPMGSLGPFMWAGTYLCYATHDGLYVWMRPTWGGPFLTIAAMELFASKEGFEA